MKISEDKKKYLNYYFEHIQSLNGLQISAIKDIAKFKGQGPSTHLAALTQAMRTIKKGM